MQTEHSNKGFLAALLDFSFSSFITTKLVRWIYILIVVVATLVSAIMILGAFADGIGRGLLALIIVPLFAAITVAFYRIFLELAIVLFRSVEYQRETAEAVQELARRRTDAAA